MSLKVLLFRFGCFWLPQDYLALLALHKLALVMLRPHQQIRRLRRALRIRWKLHVLSGFLQILQIIHYLLISSLGSFAEATTTITTSSFATTTSISTLILRNTGKRCVLWLTRSLWYGLSNILDWGCEWAWLSYAGDISQGNWNPSASCRIDWFNKDFLIIFTLPKNVANRSRWLKYLSPINRSWRPDNVLLW